MLTAAMLGLMEQTGLDILVLTEELDDREFFASRLTRLQTFQLLGTLAETARNLPAEVRARLSAIDWDAWAALPAALTRPNENALRIWVAAKELTPLTVQNLIDYKRVYPELFVLVK
ncbi:MAG: hypothetical protein B7Y41_14860 [Hydrogenophilales bacterium 28-61-23]|nr:MAG: hypothetical protein B7Y41_14860 [Hydrogenophilales bacterium 28-61-23]